MTVSYTHLETVQRQREGLALYVKDLAFPQVVKMKLRLIREWAEVCLFDS